MINKRLFGAPLRDEVKQKLTDRQKVANKPVPNESIEAVFPDKDGNNQADLSSRTPFVRMWTSVKLIEATDIGDALQEITKQEYDDISRGIDDGVASAAYARFDKLKKQYDDKIMIQGISMDDLNPNADIRYFILKTDRTSGDPRDQVDYQRRNYIIGDYNYQKGYDEVSPGDSVNNNITSFQTPIEEPDVFEQDFNDSLEAASDIAKQIFKSELETNPYMKPQSGITSITSETEGMLGIIKKTTVNFVVHNFYDYDRIFNKYFLRPGANIFVDFGWSSVNNLYNPDDLINHGKGIDDFLYAEGNKGGKDFVGKITENQGDLEVIQGIVTDYNAKVTKNGSVECSVTLTSKNSALISFETDENVVMRIKSLLDKGILFLGIQSILKDATEVEGLSEEEKSDLEQLLNTPNHQTDAKDVDAYNKNLLALAGKFLSTESGKPDNNSVRTGIFIENFNLDNTYISFGLFEDLIINSNFGFGKNEDDINQGTNSQIRIDSSNSFTSWNKNIVDSQKTILFVPEEAPTFLYPEWWGNVKRGVDEKIGSYNYQKGKWPQTDEQYPQNKQNIKNGDVILQGYDELLNRIPIREIFIHTDVIISAFQQNDSVRKVINQIIGEVSNYSSNLMNLELVRGDTESELKIVDKKYTQVDEKDKIVQNENFGDLFVFDIMSPNSIVTDYNLEFKIPQGNIGNMYAIQGMSHGDTLFSIKDDIMNIKNIHKLEKDFLSVIYEPDLGNYRLKDTLEKHNDTDVYDIYHQVNKMLDTDTYNVSIALPPQRDYIDGSGNDAMYESDAVEETTKNPPPNDEDIDYDNLIKINDEQLESVGIKVAQNFTEYFKLRTSEEVSRNVPSLLPYSLSLTMYGISTIQPGETFRVKYLPETHREKTYLQIMKVTHNIGSNGWYTSLDTQFRLKSVEVNNYETPTEITLSANAVKNLGITDTKLRYNDDNWFIKGKVELPQFLAHCTRLKVLPPEKGIDTIIEFKATQRFVDKLQQAEGELLIDSNDIRLVVDDDRQLSEHPFISSAGFPNKEDLNNQFRDFYPNIFANMDENLTIGPVVTLVDSNGTKTNEGALLVSFPSVIIKPGETYRFLISGNSITIIDPNVDNFDKIYKELKQFVMNILP